MTPMIHAPHRALALLALALLVGSGAGAARAQGGRSEPLIQREFDTAFSSLVTERGTKQRSVLDLARARSARDVVQPPLEIERGKAVLLRTDYPVRRIAIGDPAIADFVVSGRRELQLIGKGVGNTNIMIWDEDDRLQAAIDIHVGAVRAQLVRELQRVIGRNDVSVDLAGDAVVLRGAVPDVATSEAAEAVARAFFSDTTQGNNEQKVINLLSVGGNAQVMLEVKIAEMNRSIRRQFGNNMEGIFGGGRNQLQLGTFVRNLTDMQGPFQSGRLPGMGRMLNVADDTRLVASLVRGDSLVLSMFLEALEVTQLGRVLAEPTLVARSGELASFLVGGEIPIPVPQDDDSITIEFKRFGVQLEFVPTVLSEDRIHLQVTPEVSQPTQAFGGFSRNGITVPAFRTRRAATGVELADGQSFAIGGLLQEGVQSDFDRIPYLAELPILGQMFRSQRFMRDETEMVMIVTPKLVQPLGPDPLPLPGDSYVEPTRLDLLLGRIEGDPRTDKGVIRRDEDPLKDKGSDAAPKAEEGEKPMKGGLLGDWGHRLGIPRPVGEDS